MANTYGNSGNRWWVGLNSGSDSTFSGADATGTPGAYQSLPSGNASDDALFAAAAAYNKAHPIAPNTISVEHILWYNITGPYASQSDANAAIAGVQQQNPAPGLAQQFHFTNPFSSIEQALSAFYDILTNYKMWRSLGWLVLGIILMIAGLALWLKEEFGKQIASFVFPEVA
jgi:hypothetical protein